MSEQSATEETLGSEFWTQPEVLDPGFALIYATFVGALRDEVRERGGSTLEYAIIERLAFAYAFLRQRENDTENPLDDRNRREINKDWLENTMALRKMWGVEDSKNAAEVVLRKVDKAMASTLNKLPREEGLALQDAFANSFAAAGL